MPKPATATTTAAGALEVPFEILPEVAAALAARGPVVALESTVLCHGMPRPGNLELARAVEAEVRAGGAVPATVAVMDGRVRVGLGPADLRRLAEADGVAKCSTRDLPLAVAGGGLGATTVAATVFVAARVGIGVMATGGLGGVHRGGESSLDVSADLDQLARSPVAVVCSGAKAILDLPRTLERLETLGVGVVGCGCDEFPAFYTARSGLPVPRLDGPEAVARLIAAHRRLGLGAGIVIAQPPPADPALPAERVAGLVGEALRQAERSAVRGPAQTPFLLRRLAELSDGATVRVNRALLLANARLAGRLAAAVAAMPTDRG